jgi:hypothetical protein
MSQAFVYQSLQLPVYRLRKMVIREALGCSRLEFN